MGEKKLTVAAIQAAFGSDRAKNVAKIEGLVRQAAEKGAQLVVVPELFETPYFCKKEREDAFDLSRNAAGNPTIETFQGLAKQLGVAIPVSFFERAGRVYYNSVAMVDADGTLLGIYRKSHIPDGPGYEEKFYFRPGDTGFKVWKTKHGIVGVGICWDQWFPECARAMTLLGAEILVYPTAIGSEPEAPHLDTKDPWQRAMIGHAVSNVIPVVAANRIGNEDGQIFYGSSFIANHRGDKVAELGRNDESVITATFELAEIERNRAAFGFFRDRRPELYGAIVGREN